MWFHSPCHSCGMKADGGESASLFSPVAYHRARCFFLFGVRMQWGRLQVPRALGVASAGNARVAGDSLRRAGEGSRGAVRPQPGGLDQIRAEYRVRRRDPRLGQPSAPVPSGHRGSSPGSAMRGSMADQAVRAHATSDWALMV